MADTVVVGADISKAENRVGFGFVIIFAFSIFLISNDETLKIASMNASSIVAMLMAAMFLLGGFMEGRFVLKRHPVQGQLFLLFIWAVVSLLISKISPSKAIPEEVYSYNWATGLNSPEYRGMFFLFRLFLSIFAIEFIVSNIRTRKEYFTIVNIMLVLYSFICLSGLLQIVLFALWGMEVGRITIIPEGPFRIGGYVGEPQTFGIILLSGYFSVIAALKMPSRNIRLHPYLLKALLVVATIDLMFTFSLSMIAGLLVGILFVLRSDIHRSGLTAILMVCIGIVIMFGEIFYSAIVLKLIHETVSINHRTITWLLGIGMFMDNPIVGVGIGQSPLFNSRYIPEAVLPRGFELPDFGFSRQSPLNTYIEWTAETGIVGLLILFFLIYRIYKLGRADLSDDQRFTKVAYGGALLAIAVSFNSYPGGLYIGCVNLIFALYVVGMMRLSQ